MGTHSSHPPAPAPAPAPAEGGGRAKRRPWCESSDGVRILERLRNNDPTLRYLSKSSLREGDAVALGEALKTNATLQTLNLERNSVGDAGASALGEEIGRAHA